MRHQICTIILTGCLVAFSGCTPDSDDVEGWYQDYQSGKMSKARAIELMLDVLKKGNKYGSSTAAMCLGKIGDPQTVDPLLASLEFPNRFFKRKVIEALGNIGDRRATEALLTFWGQQKEPEDWSSFDDPRYGDFLGTVVEALGNIKDPCAVEPLTAQLGKDNPYSYMSLDEHIALAMGKIRDRRAIDPLVKILQRRSMPQKQGFVQGSGGFFHKSAVQVGRGHLRKLRARQKVAWALGEIADPRAVEPLLETLESAARDECDYSNQFGDDLRKLLKGLRKLRDEAKTALMKMPEASIEPFIDALAEAESITGFTPRLGAARFLVEDDVCQILAAYGSWAIDQLKEKSESDDPSVRKTAVYALRCIEELTKSSQ